MANVNNGNGNMAMQPVALNTPLYFYGHSRPDATKYIGDTSAADFLAEMERRRIQFGWTDQQTAEQFGACMRGAAQTWYNTALISSAFMDDAKLQIQRSYAEIKKKFLQRYKIKQAAMASVEMSLLTHQKMDETPCDYANRIFGELYDKRKVYNAETEESRLTRAIDQPTYQATLVMLERQRAAIAMITDAAVKAEVQESTAAYSEALAKETGIKAVKATRADDMIFLAKDLTLSGLHHSELRKHTRDLYTFDDKNDFCNFSEKLQTQAQNLNLADAPQQGRTNGRFPNRRQIHEMQEGEEDDDPEVSEMTRSKDYYNRTCKFCKKVGHTEPWCRIKKERDEGTGKEKKKNKNGKGRKTKPKVHEQTIEGEDLGSQDQISSLNYKRMWN